MKFLIVSCVLLPLLSIGSECAAAPDLVAFQLQKDCRKSADEYFARELGTGARETEDRFFYSTSTNHYNARLNKCFLLIRSKAIYKAVEEKVNSYEDVLLHELSENTLYGHYRGFLYPEKMEYCDVRSSKCHSKLEFEKVVRPLMDE